MSAVNWSQDGRVGLAQEPNHRKRDPSPKARRKMSQITYAAHERARAAGDEQVVSRYAMNLDVSGAAEDDLDAIPIGKGRGASRHGRDAPALRAVTAQGQSQSGAAHGVLERGHLSPRSRNV